ncbi:protein rep [Lactiplantibacillus plantarum]
MKNGQGHKKLAQTWFCPSRLQSLCTWRAMKQPYQLTQVLEKAVKQQKTVHFLFLTPTVENTIDALSINKKDQ